MTKMITKMNKRIEILKIKIIKSREKKIKIKNKDNITHKTEMNTHNKIDNRRLQKLT